MLAATRNQAGLGQFTPTVTVPPEVATAVDKLTTAAERLATIASDFKIKIEHDVTLPPTTDIVSRVLPPLILTAMFMTGTVILTKKFLEGSPRPAHARSGGLARAVRRRRLSGPIMLDWREKGPPGRNARGGVWRGPRTVAKLGPCTLEVTSFTRQEMEDFQARGVIDPVVGGSHFWSVVYRDGVRRGGLNNGLVNSVARGQDRAVEAALAYKDSAGRPICGRGQQAD